MKSIDHEAAPHSLRGACVCLLLLSVAYRSKPDGSQSPICCRSDGVH